MAVYLPRNLDTSSSMRQLMPHQQTAFDQFKDQNQMALFMEMRLGKCLVTIRWARARGFKRVLVVAPLTALTGWIDDLAKDEEPLVVVDAKWGERDSEAWHLCTYQRVAVDPRVASDRWDCVVLDESTAIKNPRSKTTKIALKQLARARGRAALAGKPAPEDLTNLWPQHAFVNGGWWDDASSYWTWRQRVCSLAGYDWVFKIGQKVRVKALSHAQAFYLTRAQAGLGSTPIFERRTAPASADYNRVARELKRSWESGQREARTAATVVGWLQKAAGGFDPVGKLIDCWKYAELLSLVTGELMDEQIVVWCQYSREIVRAVEILREAGVKTTFIQGAVPLAQRQARQRAMFSKDRRVIVCQTATAMRGFDLSCCSTAIYLSGPWSCEQRLQSQDRVQHPKKVDPVLIIDLVTTGSIDEDVLESVKHKNERVEWLAERIR